MPGPGTDFWGFGSGGGAGDAASVTLDTAGYVTITGTDVQAAFDEVDAALASAGGGNPLDANNIIAVRMFGR